MSGCIDADGREECQLIASNELCQLARDYMFCHCRQRCGLCLVDNDNASCCQLTFFLSLSLCNSCHICFVLM